MARGDIDNLDQVRDVQTIRCAAVNIGAGSLVYQDTTNGLKVLPTSNAAIIASRIRFLKDAVTNSGGSVGDKVADTFKGGAIVHGLCDGAIVVGAITKGSVNVAGAFQSD